MTTCLAGSRSSSSRMADLSNSSASAFSGQWMSTSGSTIGSRPAAILCGRPPFDVPVHRVLEEDGSKDPLPGEGGAGDDAGAHLVHEREHLLVVGPRPFLDSVSAQCAGRAATALIQRRYEPRTGFHLPQLFFEAHRRASLRPR